MGSQVKLLCSLSLKRIEQSRDKANLHCPTLSVYARRTKAEAPKKERNRQKRVGLNPQASWGFELGSSQTYSHKRR